MTGPISTRQIRATRATRSALRALADAAGILAGYVDQAKQTRVTSDETRVALLAAMGLDASTEARARDTLAELRRAERRAMIPPVRVVHVADESARYVVVRPPRLAATAGSGRWHLIVRPEAGDELVADGAWVGESSLQLALPVAPPLGYHELTVSLSAGGREWTASQGLIVVPTRCVAPDELLGGDRVFGIVANLYTLRSARNWGVGDLGDLATLADWAGLAGAEFVGINPLHALLNRGEHVSPYSPVSRLFRNPIYLDIGDIPELAAAGALADRIASPEMQAELAALRETSHVRYEQVMAVKGLALDALHCVFATHVRGGESERAREYDAFVAANEPALTRFATWMAIAEEQGRGKREEGSGSAYDWHSWPAELQSPDSAAVQAFAAAHAERVDYHRWVQFELDRQLGVAAETAREAGMRLGLYQDLAIGSSPAGADTWAFGDLFVNGVTVGAPPDPLAPTGQNWGFPPIDARALRRDRYRYFVQLVRGALHRGGALRIDHVLGLFRLFWIPEGRPGSEGAYVRYPSNDLLGILALESVRSRALIVGEDLGTVPREVPRALERWGILSSKVMMFERDAKGGFKSARSYPPLALATANTHDMASIAGFLQRRDIELRAEVGLADPAMLDDARRARDAEIDALLRRLVRAKVLPRPKVPRNQAELRGAVHAFLSGSPSALVGFSLDDLTGEVDPVNIPGVGLDRYPCWTRKMHVSLEQIPISADVHTALRADGRQHNAEVARSEA